MSLPTKPGMQPTKGRHAHLSMNGPFKAEEASFPIPPAHDHVAITVGRSTRRQKLNENGLSLAMYSYH